MKKKSNVHDILGQSFMYKGKLYDFQNYQEKDGVHYVVSSQKWFEFNSKEELSFFLQDLLPVDNSPLKAAVSVTTPTDEHGLVRPNSGSANILAYLKGALVEDIDRVREDPSYVEQAKTVSNNVKRLIDIARLELTIQKINNDK